MKSLMSILLALGFGVAGFAAEEKKDEKKDEAKPASTEPAKPAATEPAKPEKKGKAVEPAEAFKKMDSNNDGKLSLDEYKSVVGRKDPARAEERFKKLDKNGDGALTQDEFAAPAPKKKDK